MLIDIGECSFGFIMSGVVMNIFGLFFGEYMYVIFLGIELRVGCLGYRMWVWLVLVNVINFLKWFYYFIRLLMVLSVLFVYIFFSVWCFSFFFI